MKKLFLIAASIFFITPSFVCGLDIPKPTGWVNDFAGVIDPDNKSILNAIISSLERQTGSEIAVVTFNTLEGENIEDYSVRLFKQWGIGKKGKDNGVLVLMSVGDRQVRIETGYGIEPIIPDGLAGRIIREDMAPFFKQNDYSAGILSGVYRIANTIAQAEGAELDMRYNDLKLPAAQKAPSWLNFILLIIFIMIFIRHPLLFLFFGGFGGRGGYGGGSGGFGGGFGGFGGGFSGGGGATGRF